MTKPSVAVITSSIGRPELTRTVQSVASQTYPARHYVFVNGPQFHDAGHRILDHRSKVLTTYLPMATGVKGVGGCEPIYASAGFLLSEDIICICNDDDYFESNHIETLVNHMVKNKLDWAHSLRKIVDDDDQLICEDNCESLGSWPVYCDDKSYLVDCSSYAVARPLWRHVAPSWYVNPIGDRSFLHALKLACHAYGHTGLSTVHYRLHRDSLVKPEFFKNGNEVMLKKYPGGFPWRSPGTYRKELKNEVER